MGQLSFSREREIRVFPGHVTPSEFLGYLGLWGGGWGEGTMSPKLPSSQRLMKTGEATIWASLQEATIC